MSPRPINSSADIHWLVTSDRASQPQRRKQISWMRAHRRRRFHPLRPTALTPAKASDHHRTMIRPPLPHTLTLPSAAVETDAPAPLFSITSTTYANPSDPGSSACFPQYLFGAHVPQFSRLPHIIACHDACAFPLLFSRGAFTC